jgi:hypothetical protein
VSRPWLPFRGLNRTDQENPACAQVPGEVMFTPL